VVLRYVVDRGLLVWEGRVVRQGALIGADFMLANPELRCSSVPTVLTIVELLSLHKWEMEDSCRHFPDDAKRVRIGVVRHFTLCV
jgi:hypothetical protein